MLGPKRNNSGTDFGSVAREIADRCASATLSQLSADAQRMNIAQLRGYVRAHAWPQVWAEMQGAKDGRRIVKSQVNDAAARVLEQTVHLVTRLYLSAPTVAMPMPHCGRRAA
jgi:hypothetical protein